MRITILVPLDDCIDPLYAPLRKYGHDLDVIQYDVLPEGADLVALVNGLNPKLVITIGADAAHHPRPIPTPETFAQINQGRKSLFINTDGGEPCMIPQMESYVGIFDAYVSTDGVAPEVSNKGQWNIAWFPTDIADYPNPPRPWHERRILLGFAGAKGNGRAAYLDELESRNLITFAKKDPKSNADYLAFLSDCKVTWNHPVSGSQQVFHVKRRLAEAAMAGSLLLELRGSPAAEWFDEDKDYLTYNSVDEIASKLAWVLGHQPEAEHMALKLRDKVIWAHTAKIFWTAIFWQLRLGAL